MERHKPTRSPQEVMVLCRENEVRAAALRFTDLLGRQHQLTIPVGLLDDSAFEDGFAFDSSNVHGFSSDQGAPVFDEAELLLVPQAETAWIDPFASLPTVVLTCTVQDVVTREDLARDPRNIARRAENYLTNSGVAETALFGTQTKFFIFDDVSFDTTEEAAHYRLATTLAGRRRGGPLFQQQRGGSRPGATAEQLADVRNDMMQTLIECGVDVERHHYQFSSMEQAEIDLCPDSLVSTADALMAYRYIVKNVARRHGKVVTFMPKPLELKGGSDMHVQLAMGRATESIFAGHGYAGVSDIGLHAIGGLLAHAPALLALTCPTTNSYKRLSGADGPVKLTYSQRDRAAACRIPLSSPNLRTKWIEFCCPDSSCNPYLAFAAILMAMIDGIQNKIHPGEAFEGGGFDGASELQNLATLPKSFDQALNALEEDGDFLLRGDVFSEEVLQRYIAHKRQHEIQPLAAKPHPYEFSLYFDL